MTRFLTLTAIFCVAFSAAVASDVHMWGPTAFVHMQPTTIPGAVAVISFQNDTLHQQMVETFELTLDGLTVTVRIDALLSLEPETMTVTPPEGYIAVPESVTVPEDGAGQIVIYIGGMS
jgi:hypothetical protein